ncbi:MAG: hypothetical protein U1F11_04510 [Steroidobacteraceae bacterium]
MPARDHPPEVIPRAAMISAPFSLTVCAFDTASVKLPEVAAAVASPMADFIASKPVFAASNFAASRFFGSFFALPRMSRRLPMASTIFGRSADIVDHSPLAFSSAAMTSAFLASAASLSEAIEAVSAGAPVMIAL